MSLKKWLSKMDPKVLEEKKIDYTEETSSEPTPDAPVEIPEEWIWVKGYKGMDKNMQCRNNFQYEIDKQYDIPEGATVEACSGGFHMCLELRDVFSYVPIGDNNRFFEVLALVRKSDKDIYRSGASREPYIIYSVSMGSKLTDKLAAKSIKIIRELTADEILKSYGGHEWDDKYKQLAISVNVDAAIETMKIDELTSFGYSLPFAKWLIDNKKFEVAKAVGSQTDLSMDMKGLMIMNG